MSATPSHAKPVRIPFNRPFITGFESAYIGQAMASGRLEGDGPFTARCNEWLEQQTHCEKALLTHSGTAALELAALLSDMGPGVEAIMPSFTFVSTANAFVLRGATPVFVDIRSDTLNINEALVESAVTPRTKVIVVVHYAGVACDMESILDIARRHGLMVIEDAAQGFGATWCARPLGSIGQLGCLSFHATKNIVAGEGGALLVNDAHFTPRAEIIREKGTNRSQFFRGQVDKYTWTDIGSSYLPSELNAAFLWAQLENSANIAERRHAIWSTYHKAFEQAENDGLIRRPIVPEGCAHNAHMYYLLFPDLARRTTFIAELREHGIQAAFHYVPLHNSPYGHQVGRISGDMANTDAAAERLVRLPLWPGMEPLQEEIIARSLELIRA